MRQFYPKKVNCYFALLLLLTASSSQLSGQNNYNLTEDYSTKGNFEFGVQVGSNNFLGDLGGNIGKGSDFVKDYTLKTVRPLFGLSLNYYATHWLNFIGGINITKVTGADSLILNEGGDERWRYNRNLSFRSSIVEGYIGTEIFILPAIDRGFSSKRLSPYIGIGVGVFHFNPQAQYKGQWVNLKPLRLEGEGFAEYPSVKEYSLTQLYIPVTMGLRYLINDHFNLCSGLIFRRTNTDFIDDVGARYIEPTLFDKYLSKTDAAIAKDLYSRSKTPLKVKPGIDRADRDGNKRDSYVTFFISLRMALSSPPKYFDCWKN